MILNNPIPNRKAAAVTSCDGLEFVLLMTPLPLAEGTGNVLYHNNDARRKSY